MKYLILIILVSIPLSAKVVIHETQESLIVDGIKYFRSRCPGKLSKSNYYFENIEAVNVETGKSLWCKQVYGIKYKKNLERDEQEVYIKDIKSYKNHLVITDENNALYYLNKKTGERIKEPCIHTATSFSCVKYLRNYDGDTISFNIAGVHPLFGEKISVRINGIDTPEMKTKDKCEKGLAIKAREKVKGILSKAKRIDLLNIKRGKYFRIVADVIADRVNIKELLLKEKMGVPYSGGKKISVNWCEMGRRPAGH